MCLNNHILLLLLLFNNVIISNETNINRSSLVNYILNNANDSYADYRNLEINTSTGEDLTIKDNQFISKETYIRASDIADGDDFFENNHLYLTNKKIYTNKFNNKLEILTYTIKIS